MNETHQRLTKAKALIIAHGWGQGDDCMGLCLHDALLEATTIHHECDQAFDLVYDEIKGDSITWNDAPERTKEDVLDVLDRAATRAAMMDCK